MNGSLNSHTHHLQLGDREPTAGVDGVDSLGEAVRQHRAQGPQVGGLSGPGVPLVGSGLRTGRGHVSGQLTATAGGGAVVTVVQVVLGVVLWVVLGVVVCHNKRGEASRQRTRQQCFFCFLLDCF